MVKWLDCYIKSQQAKPVERPGRLRILNWRSLIRFRQASLKWNMMGLNYSVRKDLTGLVMAARTDWMHTVSMAINMAKVPARI